MCIRDRVQTVSATVHEIAHSKLHNQKKIQIANDEQYQEIELFDKPGLFSNGRIEMCIRDRLEIPPRLHPKQEKPQGR